MKKELGVMIFVSVCLLACLNSGCATRTIYVPNGEPVKLAKTIKGADVWVASKNGQEERGRVDLLEGWYCLPDTRTKGN